MTIKISGFSFIRNGNHLGYPFKEALQSILPLVDELVVAVGNSHDNTRETVAAIHPTKIKIIDTIWDENLRKGGVILAQQTDIALQACTGDWCIYIQGDEVLHEKYLELVKKAIYEHHNNPKVEGLLFRYKHFYGSYDYIGASKRWYRQEIRAVRNHIPGLHSYRDAQGFRIYNRKLGVKWVDAEIYHYGWCRAPNLQQNKQKAFQKLYHDDTWLEQHIQKADEYDYRTFQKLIPFTDTHPAVMQDRVKNRHWKFEYDPSKVKIPLKDQIVLGIEKLTGYRPFEYKNFKLV